MFALNPMRVLDNVETVIKELRPRYGLGPLKKSLDPPALAAPLIAASDPMHPTLLGIYRHDNLLHIRVDWVIALHNFETLGMRLVDAKRHRRYRFQLSGILVGIALILGTNRPGRRSCAGWEFDTGNVFVQDNFRITNKDLGAVTERIAGVIEHALEILNSEFEWGSLELPDRPESPLDNGFS